MAGAPPPEDGTTGLATDFSHVSLDQYSYTAHAGTSYVNHQAAGSSSADTYFPDTSDFYGSTTTQAPPPPPPPPPPHDPDKPWVCDFQYPDGRMCYKKYPRQCDLTKHQKNHSKPTACELCSEGAAEVKGLDRHYITRHPDSRQGKDARRKAREMKDAVCPVCNFDGNGRADNVRRHRKTKGH
ncbi:hypothetical protein QBC39DRAFT_15624 [Podospora conica]|nr:hypothetical protein QBC39DRAFT_15624 [Schizothecium conicum]